MDGDDRPAVVLDIGGSTAKAGFAGDDNPTCVFPSIVGRLKTGIVKKVMATDIQDVYIGDEARRKRSILRNEYPIENGVVCNWDDMQKIWHHTFFNELGVAPEDHRTLLTESPMNPKNNREHTTQIMFEAFNVPALRMESETLLPLYGACTGGSGIICCSGDGVTHVEPIYEYESLPYSSRRIDLAGRGLTEWMGKLLGERGHLFTTPYEREIVKEKMCYVALDFDEEMALANSSSRSWQSSSSSVEKDCELPDGDVVTLGSERFRCPEALFQPTLCGVDSPGIADIIYSSIMKCDKDIWRCLFKTIVLSGGSTRFEGFPERLRRELDYKNRNASMSHLTVRVQSSGKYDAWIGGSILASLRNTLETMITKAQYDEAGPSIIHRTRRE